MILAQLIILYILTFSTKWSNGTWFTPAGINNLYWCFFLTGAWIFQNEFIPLHPLSVFIIIIFCMAFSTGSLLFHYKPDYVHRKIQIINLPYVTSLFTYLKYILIFLGFTQLILIPIASYLSFGIPISFYYQPAKMILVGLQVRYMSSFVTSPFLNFLTGLNFSSFFVLGGLLALKEILKLKTDFFSILSIIITIYLGIMLVFMFNAKSSMILIFTMAISGYFAFNTAFNSDPNWFRKRLGILSIIVLLMFIIFIVLISSRYTTNDTKIFKNTLITYGFGHVFCFDNFINLETKNILWPKGFGVNTFFSLAKIFDYRLPEGVYEEMVIFSNGSESNVYTFLRGFIYDFGLIGFPVIIFIISSILHRWFEKAIKENSIWYIAITSLAYQFILYSAIISPLIYMNILVAYIIFLGIAWFKKKSINESLSLVVPQN